jgi:hypothetical protein
MATLSKPKPAPHQVSDPQVSNHLLSSVPAPFPRDLLQQNEPLQVTQDDTQLDNDPSQVTVVESSSSGELVSDITFAIVGTDPSIARTYAIDSLRSKVMPNDLE